VGIGYKAVGTRFIQDPVGNEGCQITGKHTLDNLAYSFEYFFSDLFGMWQTLSNFDVYICHLLKNREPTVIFYALNKPG